MTTYGVTSTGFVVKSLQDIKTELEAEYRAKLGASIDTSPESVLGQIIGIHAEREAELWELGLAIWASQYPDSASDVSLDNVAAITGTLRDPPRRSTVTATWTGTAGTVIPAGRVVSVTGNAAARFRTIADATVEGDGNVAVAMESEDYGPWVANAGTLTVIETPVGGITSVTNPLDAELGADEETDASLRLRREAELGAEGNGVVDSIRARILQLDDVTSVTVFENDTDETDADGVPRNSIEVMVQGGDDDEIRAAIFESKAAGISTVGDEDGVVVDDAGLEHTIRFSRPDEQPIKLEFTYTTTDDYPSTGDADVKAAVVAFARERFLVGRDVILSALEKPVWEVAGIYDLTLIRGSIHPAAFGTSNIAIGSRELADFDTSRITIIATPAVVS